MAVNLQKIAPQEIEAESFRIIAEELGPHPFDANSFTIVQRVIHATGDFSFADTIRFSDGAVDKGLQALVDGKTILTDVTMVATAISKPPLLKWGNRVISKIGDDDVAEQAKHRKTTRAEMAMELGLQENVGIIAIGNAPTALLKVIDMLNKMDAENRPLVIGVPVGFVNAQESKQLLHETELDHITSLGRKGGSPVAAAMVNALIRLAGK
jgi:precorrin-8X/cobalt-precorrin-8 methylmutase